jgi:hypothetical protein
MLLAIVIVESGIYSQCWLGSFQRVQLGRRRGFEPGQVAAAVFYLHRTDFHVPDEVGNKAYAGNHDDHSNCANDKVSHVSSWHCSVTILKHCRGTIIPKYERGNIQEDVYLSAICGISDPFMNGFPPSWRGQRTVPIKAAMKASIRTAGYLAQND